MVRAARRCKGVPQRRENGSPLQLGIAGNAATGRVAMVRAARRCKGVPQRRENGSPLQLGNAGNAATGPVAMVMAARRCKGVPQRRENGSPLQLGLRTHGLIGLKTSHVAHGNCSGLRTGYQTDRNGTESRESMPLWYEADGITVSEWPLGCPWRRCAFLTPSKGVGISRKCGTPSKGVGISRKCCTPSEGVQRKFTAKSVL